MSASAAQLERTRRVPESIETCIAEYDGLVHFVAQSWFVAGASTADVIQEGRIGLWKAWRDYRPDGGASFRNFAELCIRRQIITAVKAATRGKHRPLNEAASLDAPVQGLDGEDATFSEALPARMPSIVDIIADRDRFRALLAAMAFELSDLEQAACAHVIVDGKTYAAAAAAMGVDEKVIDNALQRVRHKLVPHLADVAA